VLVTFKTPVLSVPDVARPPFHAPLAVQLVAFVLDQVSVEESPLTTAGGEADSDTVGWLLGVFTVIVTD
jgi:hypothetical protein